MELPLGVCGGEDEGDAVVSVGLGSGETVCVLGEVLGAEDGGAGEEFSPVTEEPMDLVGSNGIHPRPSKYSSGQACMLSVVTLYPSPSWVPPVNPTATRDGIPSIRASIAMAVAKWMQ